MFYIDIYTKKYKWWMKKYNAKEKHGRYGVYFTAKVDSKMKRKLIRKLKWKNIKYRCSEDKWNRSSDYRKRFLEKNKEPFRCRYCNKFLHTENMVVDHIIPVEKAKSNNATAKNLLAIQGIKNVNDLKNLAPSCYRCNSNKDSKMGIWFLRGILGKYKWYWIIRAIFHLSLIIIALYMLLCVVDFNRIINTFL